MHKIYYFLLLLLSTGNSWSHSPVRVGIQQGTVFILDSTYIVWFFSQYRVLKWIYVLTVLYVALLALLG